MINREVNLKRVKIKSLKLRLHPLVQNLICKDAINLKPLPQVNKLSECQLLVLLDNIILNVVLSADGEHLLLSPSLRYSLLIQHPLIQKQHVNLLIHSPSNEQEISRLIDTLNLVQPALDLSELSSKSKIIHSRYSLLKEGGLSPTSLSLLAKLANKDKSTFRE